MKILSNLWPANEDEALTPKTEDTPVQDALKTDDNTDSKPKRRRRTKEEVAREQLAKGQAMVDKANNTLNEIERVKKEKERRARLMPLAGSLLKLIDDFNLPEGITENDFLAVMRMMLTWFRHSDDENHDAWNTRCSPVFNAIFGVKDKRSPAQEAAVRILACQKKAAEVVEALRPQPNKKKGKKGSKGGNAAPAAEKPAAKDETPAADTETPAAK